MQLYAKSKAYLSQSSRTRIHQHHRRKYTFLIVLTLLVLFTAFILQLLVALSLLIIDPVYLLSVVSTTRDDLPPTAIATELRFGVWGYCAISVLDATTLFSNGGECSHPRLGYEVNEQILALTGQDELLSILLKGLTVILILHPICAVLTLLALLPSLLSYIHAFAILSLIVTVASAIIASISTAVDIAIVAIAMDRVGDVTTFHFAVEWGNAPWMSLVAAVLLWVVVILQSVVVCGCCGVGQRLWVRVDDHGNSFETREAKK
ncbi:hypothetical protein A7U60_g7730 [Sanghuangporus baumii]|uniref:Pali-domain-containing protein n=1 Tax=Sanghuangporus baumii TaxID=108892 RepID=A0A9Q5HSD0_SANBA|nr:hypothetical protein A7U60_g7730 [Sanghuangporus baumii]